MGIKRLACPACHANTLQHDDEGNLVCASCGNMFEPARAKLTCRVCGTENPGEARLCMNCGTALGRLCAICGHPNPPGNDVCLECGSPLDTLAAVTSRTAEGQRLSTRIMREKLAATKTADAAYMREQRERFEQEERERLARLAAQKEAAAKEQQRLIVIAVGLMVFFATITGLLLVFLAL